MAIQAPSVACSGFDQKITRPAVCADKQLAVNIGRQFVPSAGLRPVAEGRAVIGIDGQNAGLVRFGVEHQERRVVRTARRDVTGDRSHRIDGVHGLFERGEPHRLRLRLDGQSVAIFGRGWSLRPDEWDMLMIFSIEAGQDPR